MTKIIIQTLSLMGMGALIGVGALTRENTECTVKPAWNVLLWKDHPVWKDHFPIYQKLILPLDPMQTESVRQNYVIQQLPRDVQSQGHISKVIPYVKKMFMHN